MNPRFVTMYAEAGSPHPMPDRLKWDAILHYQAKSGAPWFVETGMYKGETDLAVCGHFRRCYTIEVCRVMIDRFVGNPDGYPANVVPLLGRSYEVLPAILPALPGPRLFWLDAHGGTWGKEFGGPAEDVPACSLVNELDIVFAGRHLGDVILIDDADIFGTYGWTPLDQVKEHIRKAGYACRQEALIMVCEIDR